MKKNIQLLLVSVFMIITSLNVKSQTVGCTGTSMDPGGTGPYGNNANFTQTFCSDNGQPIYLIFTSFNLENNWDFLMIHDGNSIASPQIGPDYTGTTSPGTVTASGTCITLEFTSDGSVTAAGWAATIGCGAPPPPPPPPANDNCAGAILLTAGATCTSTSATVLNATQSLAGCSGTANDDVWFSFVATGSTQQINVNAPAGFDPVVQLFSGGCAGLTSLSCNDASYGSGANGTGNFNGLTSGQTYFYRVYDFFGGMPGTTTFSTCVQTPPPPGAGQACDIPNSFCSETIIYPAGTGGTVTAPVGPAYDCLGSQPNPAWFNMQVQSSGPMGFNISAASDIDFIIWGPFTNPTGACVTGLTAATVVDCSFSGTNNESAAIPNAIAGEYYIVMITNYSGQVQNITFSQPLAGQPGEGLGNCDILCNISGLTATPGACQLGPNTYNVTGTITTTEPPASGTLTISSSCGGTPFVMNAPFSTTMNYTVTGVPSNGAACTITASYSADGSCTRTANYTAPAACGTCTLTASNDGPYCEGAAINLTTTAVAGATYAWTGPNGFTGTGQSVSIPASTVAMAGDYSVTSTAGPAVCTATTTVVINTIPVITVNSETICDGASTTLTANGATSYTWSPATGLSATTGASVTSNPTATQIYLITGDNLGCTSTVNATVTVVPNPTITVNSPTICAGENGFLTASGATILTWSPATNLSSTSGANVTSNSPNTIIYTVTGIEQGCSSTATSTLTVNPAPVLAVNSATYCEGGSATLTVTGATTYVWSPATGLSSTTSDVVTANPTVTTVYSISAATGSCNATTTTTVTVNANPIVDAGLDGIVCSGSSTGLLATGAFSYVWAADPSLNNTNIAGPTATPTATTIYSVTGTDVNGCVGTDIVTIDVPPAIVLTPIAIPASCFASATGAVSVSASPATGPYATYSYNWNNGSTAQILNNLVAGTYSVVVTDLASCTASASVTVTEPPILSLVESTNTPVTCNAGNDGTSSVTATGGTPVYTYLWSPTGVTTSANNALSVGNYTVTATDVNGCLTTTTLTITEPLAVSLSPVIGSTICISQNTNLSASASGGAGGYVYTWLDGTNTFAGNVINVNPTTTTSYTVSAVDVNGCPSINTQSVTVIVNPPLSIDYVASSAICEGDIKTVDVTAHGGNGIHTFSWMPMTGVTIITPNGSSVKLNPNTTINYTVSVNDNCGTPAADTNFVLTINPKPVLTITPATTSGCQPLEVNFSGNSSTVPVQCYWNFGNTTNSYSCSPTTVFTVDGTYSVSYNVTDINGCTNFTTSTVNVFPVPRAAFLANPQPTTIIDPEVTFTDITDATIVNQTWFFNDSLGTYSGLASPSYIYPAPGEYLVTLAVETDRGCVDTTTQTVIIEDYFVVYVPNSFSPDGDGINETFTAYGNGITDFKMGIYDRWGGKIMETSDIYEGWDGKKSGNKVEKGVYIFRMELVNFLGERKLLSGHVNVVR